MEHRGWVSSYWGETNRRARYYRRTAAGEKQLPSEVGRWRQMPKAIALVMGDVMREGGHARTGRDPSDGIPGRATSGRDGVVPGAPDPRELQRAVFRERNCTWTKRYGSPHNNILTASRTPALIVVVVPPIPVLLLLSGAAPLVVDVLAMGVVLPLTVINGLTRSPRVNPPMFGTPSPEEWNDQS
ncbi:MAG TPA: hypothetical protein VHX37_11270 [Acidobacteriaceae bacterium]|nr:hypothetical protein [Acidobacteriaceae bacterium]